MLFRTKPSNDSDNLKRIINHKDMRTLKKKFLNFTIKSSVTSYPLTCLKQNREIVIKH